jgi:hypothetical protein
VPGVDPGDATSGGIDHYEQQRCHLAFLRLGPDQAIQPAHHERSRMTLKRVRAQRAAQAAHHRSRNETLASDVAHHEADPPPRD